MIQSRDSAYSIPSIRVNSSIDSIQSTQVNSGPMPIDIRRMYSRYFRLSNKRESPDPITGVVKRYQPYNQVGPLGKRNVKVSEKINNAWHSEKDLDFYRQTKKNPKYHALNPITGEISHRKITQSLVPIDYKQRSYSPDLFKPVRIYKGLGYKKSDIFL